jgi:hypothetical protein
MVPQDAFAVIQAVGRPYPWGFRLIAGEPDPATVNGRVLLLRLTTVFTVADQLSFLATLNDGSGARLFTLRVAREALPPGVTAFRHEEVLQLDRWRLPLGSWSVTGGSVSSNVLVALGVQ